jgi:glutamate synthase (NADPH/NADH) small chain
MANYAQTVNVIGAIKTTKKAVWAGGDIVTGAAAVILAMGAGRDAANSMHDYLTLGW